MFFIGLIIISSCNSDNDLTMIKIENHLDSIICIELWGYPAEGYKNNKAGAVSGEIDTDSSFIILIRDSDIFRKTTGQNYTNDLPPSLWLLVKNYNHSLLAFDPYGAITVPVYTFSLNAAEVEDLQTINGLSRLEAEKIISYRDENGFFTDLSQLESIPDLEKSAIGLITSCGFTTIDFENILEDFDPELSLNSLLIMPLKSILLKSLMFFIGIFSLVYLVLIRKSNPGIRKISILFFRYLLLWILLVFIGLIVVVIAENAIKYGLILALILIISPLMIYSKSKEKRLRTLMSISLMALVIVMSLL